MTTRWTWHGGGVAAASAHFGGAAESWLDLSTGINPHAWPGAAEQAINWRALPDEQGLRALEQAAADHFGAAADHVCALPGTEVGLRLVGTLLDGSVRHASPAYRTHGAMVSGAAPVDLDHLDEADGETLILANPNNPDGRIHGVADLLALLDRRGSDGWLVVDEAFADAVKTIHIALWISLLIIAAWWLPALLAAPLLMLVWGLWLKRRLGGISGDGHGAGIELVESGLLFVVLIAGGTA